MPATRCSCPSCHYLFSVPDDIVGKRSRCPKCRTTLLVRAIGGKTALALAGVDGAAPTQSMNAPPLPVPAGDEETFDSVLVSAPPLQRKQQSAGLNGWLVALLVFVCAVFALTMTVGIVLMVLLKAN